MSSWHVARHVVVVDGWLRAQGLTGATGANDSDTQGRCFPYCRCHYASLPLTVHDSLGENPVWIPCTSDDGASGATSFFLEVSCRIEFVFTDWYLVLLLIFDEGLPFCVALHHAGMIELLGRVCFGEVGAAMLWGPT
jgi:hypothetical protein